MSSPNKAELGADRASFEARQGGKALCSSLSIPAIYLHALPTYALGGRELHLHLHKMGTIGRTESLAICNTRDEAVAYRLRNDVLWPLSPGEYPSPRSHYPSSKDPKALVRTWAAVSRQAVRPQQAALCGSCRIKLHGALRSPNLGAVADIPLSYWPGPQSSHYPYHSIGSSRRLPKP